MYIFQATLFKLDATRVYLSFVYVHYYNYIDIDHIYSISENKATYETRTLRELNFGMVSIGVGMYMYSTVQNKTSR